MHKKTLAKEESKAQKPQNQKNFGKKNYNLT